MSGFVRAGFPLTRLLRDHTESRADGRPQHLAEPPWCRMPVTGKVIYRLAGDNSWTISVGLSRWHRLHLADLSLVEKDFLLC